MLYSGQLLTAAPRGIYRVGANPEGDGKDERHNGGRHAAVVLLPNRHYFDGLSIHSYFDHPAVQGKWYQTDLDRPDTAHPQDRRANDCAVRHRTEYADTARREGTVDRAGIKNKLDNWMLDHVSGLLPICGEPGTGKSYLLAKLLPRWFNDPGDKLVIRGFKAGCGTNSVELVSSLCYEMLWQLGCDGQPGENSGEGTRDDLTRLRRWFRQLLEAVGRRHREHRVPACRTGESHWEPLGRLLIGIDTLDEGRLEDAAWLTELLPPDLPKGIYVVVTSRPSLIGALSRRGNCLRLLLNRHGEQKAASEEGWQTPPDGALGKDIRAYLEKNLIPLLRVAELTNPVVKAAQDNLLLTALITRQVCACLTAAPNAVRVLVANIIHTGVESIDQAFWASAAAKVKTKSDRKLLRSALGVLVIAAEPITLRGIQAGSGARRSIKRLGESLRTLETAGLVERRGVGKYQLFSIGLHRYREYLREVGIDGYPVPADVQACHAKLGRWCLT